MVQSLLCLYLKHNWFNYVANGHEWLCDFFERYLEVPKAFVFAIIIRSIFEHHFEFLSTQNSFLWCQTSEHWHFSFSLSPCRFTFNFFPLKVVAVVGWVHNHKSVCVFDFHSKRLELNNPVLWVDWSQIFVLIYPCMYSEEVRSGKPVSRQHYQAWLKEVRDLEISLESFSWVVEKNLCWFLQVKTLK